MQYQNDQNHPKQPPLLKINLLEAIAAIVVITIFVAGFHAILPVAGYAVYVVIGVALAYVGIIGYHTFDHHRKLAVIDRRKQEALAEREEILNQQEKARALSLIQPDSATGNYPIWIDEYGQPHVFRPGNLVQPVPHTLHYAPQSDYRVSGKEVAAASEVPQIAPPLALPGPISMLEVMRHFDLSPEHLFLALDRGGHQLVCSIEEFMHVAHDGPTGSGKTMQWKAELIMLLKADVLTFLANPHFAPITKKGEDWRPIGRALEAQEMPGKLPPLLYTFEQIRDFLKWLSLVEIDRRFERQRQGRYDYPPLYGFVDEWAAVVAKYEECGAYMQDIIRRGRAVDVCISTNSQGFLVNDIGMSGASRENFQTAYHLGGSVQSAAALLDMRQQDITKLLAAEQVTLGRGIGLLRNNSVSDPAQLVRLPYADNDYTYYMLGRADTWTLPGFRTVSMDPDPTETAAPLLETVSTARGETSEPLDLVSRNETEASVKAAAAAVSSETKEQIRRLIEKTTMPWREIASAVGMASEKYVVFREVCRQMGYDTSTRRDRKGGKS
jgi:hypothetical protein